MKNIVYLEMKLVEQTSTINTLQNNITVLKNENLELTKKVEAQRKELKRLNNINNFARSFAEKSVDYMIHELVCRQGDMIKTIEALRNTNKMLEKELKKIYEPESEEQND